MKLSIKAAIAFALKVLRAITGKLNSQQALSLLGDILVLFVPVLSKDDLQQLAHRLARIDSDRQGLEDRAADLLIQLGGGRVEDLLLEDHQVELPTAELPL